MLDEDALSEALARSAGRFEIPVDALERILDAANAKARPTEERKLPRSLRSALVRSPVPRSRSGRLGLAAVVVALAGVGFAISGVASSARATHGTPTLEPPTGRPSVGAGAASPLSAARPSRTGAPGRSQSSENPVAPGSVGQSAKIEASGTVDLTVGKGKIHAALGELSGLAAGDDGFVSSTQAQYGTASSGTPTATIVLQVPEPSFAAVVTQVQRFGKATSVSTSSSDVTGQYVDLQARIDAAEASRQQYLTIMTHATSIGDILAVQNQIDSIQSDIEQMQGQLQVLDNETTYGSLTVNVTQTGPPPPKPVAAAKRASGISKAWHKSVSGFVSGFEWLVRIAGPLLFVLILLAAIALVGIWGWRSARRRLI